MALVHTNATIRPTKLEVVQRWLGEAAWFDGDADALSAGSRFTYRFEDPAGAVGVETVMARADGYVVQLPLTYREAPLDGADEHLVTRMDHSVLGKRFVYFGLGDPVLVRAFLEAVVTGGRSADLEYEQDGRRQSAQTDVAARGTGSGELPGDLVATGVESDGPVTTVHTSIGDLQVPHLLDGSFEAASLNLLGSWEGSGGDVVLARLTSPL